MRENKDQNNSEYGKYLHSDFNLKLLLVVKILLEVELLLEGEILFDLGLPLKGKYLFDLELLLEV